MAKPSYTKPASQLDLEARQAKDYQPAGVLQSGVDPEPSENGYVGVDPIYQTFANETEKPHAAEKGAEQKAETEFYSDDVDFDAAATPEGEGDAESEPTPTTPSGSTPPQGSTPPSS